MGKITNCKDLLMILLYAKGSSNQQCEPIVGKTRLMKMVFLFSKEILKKFNLDTAIAETALPNFEAFKFGPFATKVYEDLEFLVEMGLVEVFAAGNEELLEDEKLEYDYWQATSGEGEQPFQTKFSLTDLGIEFVQKKLKKSLSDKQWDVLDEFKKRCTSATLRALLKYVYTRYPETTTNSTIRDEVL